MTIAEKLRLMETLWSDLTRDEERFESPAWHGEVLRERAARVKQGKESFMDWEMAKKQLRNRVKMRILILPSRGMISPTDSRFMNGRKQAWGIIFWNRCFPTLNRFEFTRESIPSSLGIIGCCPSVFPMPSFTIKNAKAARVWAVLDCRSDPDAIREKARKPSQEIADQKRSPFSPALPFRRHTGSRQDCVLEGTTQVWPGVNDLPQIHPKGVWHYNHNVVMCQVCGACASDL